MLNTFTALKSLEWKNATVSETGFFAHLENLTGLTKLILVGLNLKLPFRSVQTRQIFALRTLRSIEIVDNETNEDCGTPYPFSNLSQLTKLLAAGFTFKDSLRTLTNLVHLQSSFSTEPNHSLFQSLVHLTKLETLNFAWVHKGFVRENILSRLTNLSSLFVGFHRAPGKTFLSSLAFLPKLKSLSLLYYRRDDDGDFFASMVHISRLSGLTKLGFFVEGEWNALEMIPEQSFPRLQRVEYLFTWQPSQIAELKLRFPSVVRVHRSKLLITESSDV